ncbi:MAG: hypothetical protein HY319_06440 [Armatimonadetes bacterium]|nr:hypothetical protein [Armatimonadota bacterium]
MFERLMEAAKTMAEAGETLVEAGWDRSQQVLEAARRTDAALISGEATGAPPAKAPEGRKDPKDQLQGQGQNGLALLAGLLRAFG